MKNAIFWFRRDLRLTDNTALNNAISQGYHILPIFIFDEDILDTLPKDDSRVNFIYQQLLQINTALLERGSNINVQYGKPKDIINELVKQFDIHAVFCNEDYEPYAIQRDMDVRQNLNEKGILFEQYTDHVIFKPGIILKSDGTPYTVYTPYKRRWLERFADTSLVSESQIADAKWVVHDKKMPSLSAIGFGMTDISVPPINWQSINGYEASRDFPAESATTLLGTHLRFGTISPREVISQLKSDDAVFLSELIWREFFIQILYHFPKVVNQSFKPAYDHINWKNNEEDFEKWTQGMTGYPMVDAGMRQLNQTGFMHNRVRMVVASFLCKHLLIDWRWGEAYFAQKLLDYELASNNGNWQWAAGTGCDAAPYFRVFNPTSQQQKFDPKFEYIKTWVKEWGTPAYPQPIVDHAKARIKAIDTYKFSLEDFRSKNDMSNTVSSSMPNA